MRSDGFASGGGSCSRGSLQPGLLAVVLFAMLPVPGPRLLGPGGEQAPKDGDDRTARRSLPQGEYQSVKLRAVHGNLPSIAAVEARRQDGAESPSSIVMLL